MTPPQRQAGEGLFPQGTEARCRERGEEFWGQNMTYYDSIPGRVSEPLTPSAPKSTCTVLITDILLVDRNTRINLTRAHGVCVAAGAEKRLR